MNHTSAPWEFRHVAGLPLTIVDAKGGVIAFVDRRAHRGGEGMANGHLLEAAPRLLAACEGARDLMGLMLYVNNFDSDTDRDLMQREYERHCAVVAAAKGETP